MLDEKIVFCVSGLKINKIKNKKGMGDHVNTHAFSHSRGGNCQRETISDQTLQKHHNQEKTTLLNSHQKRENCHRTNSFIISLHQQRIKFPQSQKINLNLSNTIFNPSTHPTYSVCRLTSEIIAKLPHPPLWVPLLWQKGILQNPPLFGFTY
jgi:hypothetical protein